MNRKRRRKIEQELDALYRTLPTIECKGLCSESCGPIAMTTLEFDRVSEQSKTVPSIKEDGTCTLLKNKRCSVYKFRPMICRLWGLSEKMPCEFGCVPSRVLTKEEGYEFLRKAMEIAGNPDMVTTIPDFNVPRIVE